MITQAGTCYRTTRFPLAVDPLDAAASLVAADLYDQYILYECAGQWSFAGGVLAEIMLDQAGARISSGGRVTVREWGGPPLSLVKSLLEELGAAQWRAYGWAAFELAYALRGDRRHLGNQRLLHLLIPRTEVRFEPGQVLVRSTDKSAAPRLESILRTRVSSQAVGEPPAVDVRRGAAEYLDTVESARARIISGGASGLRKVILSRRVAVEGNIDLVGSYQAGRRTTSPARSFMLRLGGIESAGFSPETVVRVTADGQILSSPLAGTRALTSRAAENHRLRDELRADPKEVYEHAIAVQVAHDELGDVCVPGSVRVQNFMAVKERGSVQHLASELSGQLMPGRSSWDALAAVFPAVTGSGVPKDACYPLIRELEPGPRGLYGGAVLTLDQTGALDAALVLRSIFRAGGETWLQAGAGVVAQSEPGREFEETCEKLNAVVRSLRPERS